MTVEGRKTAYNNLKANGVDSLVVIGGDGTFTGAEKFNEEFGFSVIGIPGTIDNDIFGTSHTLGYDTALNTVVEAIDKIRDTANSHNRLFFVEVMGRDAGHIALNAGIGAGAEEILIPEEAFGLDRLVDSLKKSKESGKTSIGATFNLTGAEKVSSKLSKKPRSIIENYKQKIYARFAQFEHGEKP
jgi:6-phosphofructokinase 1